MQRGFDIFHAAIGIYVFIAFGMPGHVQVFKPRFVE